MRRSILLVLVVALMLTLTVAPLRRSPRRRAARPRSPPERETGVIAASALRVDWKLVIAQPRLSYTLETAWLITFPGTSPCAGSERTAGTLVKQ